MRELLETRLRAKIIKVPGQCWEWKGGTDRKGYGLIRIKGVSYRAHRLAFLLWVGDIPSGQFVCHSCDNPQCCNPTHLWTGTVGDNVRDSVAKGRWTSRFNAIGKVSGENNGKCKYTDQQVHEMRCMWREGYTLDAIQMVTGAHRNWIHKIVSGVARKPERAKGGRRAGASK